VRAIGGSPVVIAMDSLGIYSMSTICTHDGCDMESSGGSSIGDTGLSCGCHGSAFDADGNVTSGPARSPLTHWRVDIAADGSLTIQGGVPVSQSTRVSAMVG
jgi:Rieske Fe-S protein